MQFYNVVTTLLSFHHTQWSPTTSSYASLNSPCSSFDMLDLDFICTSPMWSSLTVHIVGMSIATLSPTLISLKHDSCQKWGFQFLPYIAVPNLRLLRQLSLFLVSQQLLSHQNRELYDMGIHLNLPRQSFYIQTGHFCYTLFAWQSAYQSMV